MHRFTIVPADQRRSSIDVLSVNVSAVLPLIDHLGCGTASVLRDGIYVFSAEPDPSGFWSIFQLGENQPHTS